MKKLSVEDSEAYKKIEKRVTMLNLVKQYYASGANYYEFDSGDVPLRELIRFMNDEGYPRRLPEADIVLKRIDEEINELNEKKKNMRLEEIESRNLNSLLIIPSWTKLIGTQMKGYYLGKPVRELKRDTIVMLTDTTQMFKEITEERIAVIFGPGIFYSEFSIEPGNFLTNSFEINGICLPLDLLGKIYTAEKIYHSDKIEATITEVSTILPFHIIEQPQTIQAYIRGVISRNVFYPNKAALEFFNKHAVDDKSYKIEEGFKILSAHPLWFNKLLVNSSQIPKSGSGKKEYSTAGLGTVSASINKILPLIFSSPSKEEEQLEKIKEIAKQYKEMGLGILKSWIPT
ncbi:MAG: hypothetical protein K9W45_05875 [Candidatus Heimdallarchaeum aukensis]|uniref:Uncharacterized protein n=1 Tax=Candidatus Heimdallarchaeum aukensis TaxID=2876573 RepID=A0A9Y1BN77_9ARCH|nr:MAG: hypothetical protein K9W45_05875 [Candidatus Heimdallarchaeum aukensis]